MDWNFKNRIQEQRDTAIVRYPVFGCHAVWSVFYGKYLKVVAGPCVSDDVGGVIPSGRDINLDGNQRFPHAGGGRYCADYDDWQLPREYICV